jgi:hypothetical protein
MSEFPPDEPEESIKRTSEEAEAEEVERLSKHRAGGSGGARGFAHLLLMKSLPDNVWAFEPKIEPPDICA